MALCKSWMCGQTISTEIMLRFPMSSKIRSKRLGAANRLNQSMLISHRVQMHIRETPERAEIVWPKISLVTAVYNGDKYLEATIRSVLGQGYPNLEYIIVDGGSTDGTLDIIRKYENQVSCWFRQKGSGVYAALNQGFARSTGMIMGWLNSSDML